MIITTNEVRQMAKKWRIMFRIKDNFVKLGIRNAAAEYGIGLHEEYKDDITYFFVRDAVSEKSFEQFLRSSIEETDKKIVYLKERIWGVRVNCITDVLI